jgi:hypothetical protein
MKKLASQINKGPVWIDFFLAEGLTFFELMQNNLCK